jgi:hypothetical protein
MCICSMYVDFLHIGRIRMDVTTQGYLGLDKTCKASNVSML